MFLTMQQLSLLLPPPLAHFCASTTRINFQFSHSRSKNIFQLPFWSRKVPGVILSISMVLLMVVLVLAAVFGVILYRMSMVAALSIVDQVQFYVFYFKHTPMLAHIHTINHTHILSHRHARTHAHTLTLTNTLNVELQLILFPNSWTLKLQRQFRITSDSLITWQYQLIKALAVSILTPYFTRTTSAVQASKNQTKITLPAGLGSNLAFTGRQ